MEPNNSSEVNDHLANKKIHIYEIRKLIAGLEVPVTGPYPEPDASCPYPQTLLHGANFEIIPFSMRRCCEWYLIFIYLVKFCTFLIFPTRVTCP
jgi:hypothetical protein